MGRISHHALLITTFTDDAFDRLEDVVQKIYGHDCYMEAVSSQWNGYRTLVIGPDGSKEGWPESDKGDRYRDSVIEWLNRNQFEDGSSRYSWVEVQYGDDNRETKVTRDSDQARRNPAPPVCVARED